MKRLLIIIFVLFTISPLFAQKERWQVRAGNRAYDNAKYQKAELDYRRALEKDSTSVTAKYNLANTMYRQKNVQGAEQMAAGLLKSAGAKTSDKDSTATQETSAPVFMSPENMAKTYHNLGNFTLNQKKYSEAVEAYKNSLRLNPKDMETKSNLAYAQKMLKDQQDKQNKQNQDQNKDQNKDQDKDKNKDKNDQNKDKQDPNKDQNKDPEKPQNQQAPPPKITPQAAQQMLQAIQNKENETQDKVKKEKAKLLESRKNEKNW